MNKISQKKGFTLVELLVVLFIIAIMSSLVIIATVRVRMNSRDNKRKADIADIANAVELYYSQNHSLPANQNFAVVDVISLNNLIAQYLPKPPYDPLLKATNETAYKYYQTNNGHYCIFTKLETINAPSQPVPSLCKTSDGSNSIGYPSGTNYYIEK